MLTASPRDLTDDSRLLPIDVGLYHRMIANGDLEEGAPFELLDGMIVRKDRSHRGEDPMTVGKGHAWTVQNLSRLNRSLEPLGCLVRVQQPVTLPDHDEPEPDGAVVRGGNDDYLRNHPGPTDVLCLFEVADSSLRRDRTVKLRIYADHGIERYVILNLVDRVAEVYMQPRVGSGRYDRSETLGVGDILSLPTPVGGPFEIGVGELLPPDTAAPQR